MEKNILQGHILSPTEKKKKIGHLLHIKQMQLESLNNCRKEKNTWQDKKITTEEGAEIYETTCLRDITSLRAAKLKLIFPSKDELLCMDPGKMQTGSSKAVRGVNTTGVLCIFGPHILSLIVFRCKPGEPFFNVLMSK